MSLTLLNRKHNIYEPTHTKPVSVKHVPSKTVNHSRPIIYDRTRREDPSDSRLSDSVKRYLSRVAINTRDWWDFSPPSSVFQNPKSPPFDELQNIKEVFGTDTKRKTLCPMCDDSRCEERDVVKAEKHRVSESWFCAHDHRWWKCTYDAMHFGDHEKTRCICGKSESEATTK